MAAETFLEGDECFGARHAEVLDALEESEHVVVVACKDFDEDVVFAGGIVTFDNFGYFLEGRNNGIVLAWVAEVDTDVGASVVTHGCGSNEALGADNGTVGEEALYALVDSGP